MSQPPRSSTSIPTLTPQFCFNTRLLRDFLRLSRSQLDDSISTNLNSLVTPSTTRPFEPSSTSNPQRSPRPRIPSAACADFASRIVFPTWQSRTAVLSYCSSVATSPDPDDPELIDREVASRKDADRIVDERLDPYSARFFPREPRTEQLAAVLRNENLVERIVRRKTWGVLAERCDAEGVDEGWEAAMGRWRVDRG